MINIPVIEIAKWIFSDQSTGILALMSIFVAIWRFQTYQKNKRREAAETILSEVLNAQRVISVLKNFNFNGTTLIPERLLPKNSWKDYGHIFIKKLSSDEYELVNDFYNSCQILDDRISEHDKVLYSMFHSQVNVGIQKLVDLNQKAFDKINDKKNKDIELQKLEENAIDEWKKITNILNKQWFISPLVLSQQIKAAIDSVKILSGTSALEKISKIASQG